MHLIHAPNKIAITGARGMLGTAILNRFSTSCDIFATSRQVGLEKRNIHWELLDLLDFQKLTAWLEKNKPDVVIHCAAMVDVDGCEKDSVNAKALHVDATSIIAKTILPWQGRLIYISTDAVFDGKKSGFYAETDEPTPQNSYGHTKYFGELETLRASQKKFGIAHYYFWSPPHFRKKFFCGLDLERPY